MDLLVDQMDILDLFTDPEDDYTYKEYCGGGDLSAPFAFPYI